MLFMHSCIKFCLGLIALTAPRHVLASFLAIPTILKFEMTASFIEHSIARVLFLYKSNVPHTSDAPVFAIENLVKKGTWDSPLTLTV